MRPASPSALPEGWGWRLEKSIMTLPDTSEPLSCGSEEGETKRPPSAEDFARAGRVTPMVRQYLGLKRANPDCLLLYRLGDFYECFFEDALVAAEVLEITLTGRGKGEDRFPMAGIPAHAGRSYIGRLVEAGHRVAICEQVEDAAEAKGLVQREVVQIVTPGMVVDDELLDPRSERMVAAISLDEKDGGALAFLELSTGAFRATMLEEDSDLAEELVRASPRELIVSDRIPEGRMASLTRRLPGVAITTREPRSFDAREGRSRLERHLRVASLAGFGVPEKKEGDLVVGAAGAVLRYASEASSEAAIHIDRLEVYDPRSYLVLDSTTMANLEVLATFQGGRRKGSLLGYIDKTATAMGGRRLRAWLTRPLSKLSSIEKRQSSVACLVDSSLLSDELHRRLRGFVDIERLLGRLALGHGNGRDLRGLARSLLAVPELKSLLSNGTGSTDSADILGQTSSSSSFLSEMDSRLDPLSKLASELDRALVDDPPAALRDGGIIRPGYDAELDELVNLSTSGKDHLLEIEAKERKSTGIGSLKVRHNRVFGYYIEVTKPNLHLVPPRYTRKQTTANAERFVTPELQSWEEKVVTADEKRRVLELRLFERLRERVISSSGELGALAEAIADLDATLSLALRALESDWRPPELHSGKDLLIEDGRHPVVEAALRGSGEAYVPSDVELNGERPLMIVTGPNMSGKSTVMRMAALVVILAHVGSFVPAKRARVGICDRVFTRVGASDDLAGGRSTFMVEMTESAAILNQATERSLVVLDEIGRGTSTFDGLSIAWAVAEDLHDRVRCRALFATHYHELTDLAKEREGVVNFTVAVREWNEEVVFLRRLIPGAANRSYGIQVARLAGLPGSVLDRASEVLANLESAELDDVGRPALAKAADSSAATEGQLSLFKTRSSSSHSELTALLERVDPDSLSPKEALELLYELKGLLARKA